MVQFMVRSATVFRRSRRVRIRHKRVICDFRFPFRLRRGARLFSAQNGMFESVFQPIGIELRDTLYAKIGMMRRNSPSNVRPTSSSCANMHDVTQTTGKDTLHSRNAAGCNGMQCPPSDGPLTCMVSELHVTEVECTTHLHGRPLDHRAGYPVS